MRILICEDENDIAEVMKTVLENSGHEISLSDNCGQIFQTIEKFNPDLILLDIWLPGPGGSKIAEQLKSDPKTNKIPIIIISASSNTAEIAKELGVSDFLSKPFDIDDLLALVHKYER